MNLVGCFAVGIVWGISENRLSVSPELRTVILIGFLGAFTTFSSFMYETNELLRDSLWLQAAGNLLGQNLGRIAFLLLGLAAGKYL